jgi:hypothetical protein
MSEGWTITQGPVEMPSDRDSHLFRLRYSRGDVEREVFVHIFGTVFVHIFGTAMAAATETLPGTVAATVATRGRAAVEDSLARGRNPEQIRVNASGGVWEHPAD